MSETFEEYTARILGYSKGKDTFRILRSTPGKLAKLTAKTPRRKLTTPPAPGKWTVGQILAHLSEVETLWAYRVRVILETDGVELLGMDQDNWARNSRYDTIDPKISLDLFRAARAANLELFGKLSPREINRHGRHSQFGHLTIRKIQSLMAGHDINHTRQVARILRAH